MNLRIVHYPHPALRHHGRPVKFVDAELRRQVARMLELMYDARGVGLAALQVMLPYNLVVLNLSASPDRKDAERVLLNPRVVERAGTQDGEEGCLSFPGMFTKIKRARSVTVEADGLDGSPIHIAAVDLESRALQHEIDHLDGMLFIDRFGPLGKIKTQRRLRDMEERFRRAQQKGEIPPDVDLEKTLRDLEQDLEQRAAAGVAPPV
ncbi:MAG: peptide deformylase [Planctomycetia bacterium]